MFGFGCKLTCDHVVSLYPVKISKCYTLNLLCENLNRFTEISGRQAPFDFLLLRFQDAAQQERWRPLMEAHDWPIQTVDTFKTPAVIIPAAVAATMQVIGCKCGRSLEPTILNTENHWEALGQNQPPSLVLPASGTICGLQSLTNSSYTQTVVSSLS